MNWLKNTFKWQASIIHGEWWMCSLHANTINFFYSSLYFLLKHITLSYGGFNTVSKLYGGDPCSALLFPGASLIMQYHNSLHSQSLLGSTSRRDYQTAQPHNTIRRHKKNKTKQNQLMCTLSSFPPLVLRRFRKFFHTHGPIPRSALTSLLMQQNEETEGDWREEEVMRRSGQRRDKPPGSF